MTLSLAVAQDEDPNKITENDKKVFQDFVEGRGQEVRLAAAITNLRQIGLMLFEFETEFGEFPNEKTARVVKEATETEAELKGATANDCFFQLVAANMTTHVHLFTLNERADEKPPGADKKPTRLEKCDFAYLSGMNAAGNPGRPLVVAPLVKGQTMFDPKVLGGKAVVLRADNSVQSFPIQPDGRVLIDGRDVFDPAQPFWNGKVPPIKWPEN